MKPQHRKSRPAQHRKLKPVQRRYKVAINFIIGIGVTVALVLGFSFYRIHQNKVTNYSQEVATALHSTEKIATAMTEFYGGEEHTFLSSSFNGEALDKLNVQLADAKIEKKNTLLNKETRPMYKQWEVNFAADKKVMADLQAKDDIQTQLNALFEKPVLETSQPEKISAISMSVNAKTLASVKKQVDKQQKINDDDWAKAASDVFDAAQSQLDETTAALELLKTYQKTGTEADYKHVADALGNFKEGLWKTNQTAQLATMKKTIAEKGLAAVAPPKETDKTANSPTEDSDDENDVTDDSDEENNSQSTSDNKSTEKKETPATVVTPKPTEPTTPKKDETTPSEDTSTTTDSSKQGESSSETTTSTPTESTTESTTESSAESEPETTDAPRPLAAYHGGGTEYGSEADAENAGVAAVTSGIAKSYNVVAQGYTDGSLKFYLELH